MLDLRGISSFTDFFVICSGTSEPQLKAIANEIETRLREDYSLRPVAVDGFPASQWMVLDYLQVVVHIFHRDKRAFYSLEGLWGDAPVLQWESALCKRALTTCPAASPLTPTGCPAVALEPQRQTLTSWLAPVAAEEEPSENPAEHPGRRCRRRFHIQQFDVKNQSRVRQRCPDPLHARHTRGSTE